MTAGNGKDALSVSEVESMIGGKFDPDDLAKLDGSPPSGVTRALLEGQMQALRQDQASALAIVNQCSGAIAIVEMLLKRMGEADVTRVGLRPLDTDK